MRRIFGHEQARLGEVGRALRLPARLAQAASDLVEEPRRRRIAPHVLRAHRLAPAQGQPLQRFGALALGLLQGTLLGGDQGRLVAHQRPESRPHPAAVDLLLKRQLETSPGADPQRPAGQLPGVAHFQQREERRDRHLQRRPMSQQRHCRDHYRGVAAGRAVLGRRHPIPDRGPFEPGNAEVDRPAQLARGVRLHRTPDRRSFRRGESVLGPLVRGGASGDCCGRVAARASGHCDEHAGPDGRAEREHSPCLSAAQAGRKEDEVGREGAAGGIDPHGAVSR